MSLFRRIFMLVSLTIVIILFTITSIMVGNQRKSIEVEADYNMSANMSIVVSQLRQTVDHFTATGLSFSNNKEITAYLKAMDLEDEIVVNDALAIIRKIKESSVLLNNVTLTPKGGVIRVDALGAFYNKGPDESELEYYLELSENPTMKSFINKPLIGTANSEPIFGIGIQMDNDDEFLGILGLPINLNRLMESVIMPDITDDDIKVLMVNTSGTIVWASNKEQIHNEDVNLVVKEPLLFDYIKSSKRGSLQQELLGVEAQINYEYYDVFDSYIIIYKDISSYNTLLTQTLITSIIISLLILLISSLLIYLALVRMTRPISDLVEYSNRVANGDYNVQISRGIIHRSDEIGNLGRTYQIMIDSLNRSFKEVQTFGERYHFLANHDELTDLPNRRNFNKRINELIKLCHSGSVIMIDIDDFKEINDTMGHIVGDQVLKKVGDILTRISRENTYVSRFGGDEFIIFVRDSEACESENNFIETFLKHFAKPILVNDQLVEINFSMGISHYPNNSENLDELTRQADIALYMAKSKGKNRVHFFDEDMERKVFKKVNIEKELHDAIENDGFKLLYQPQVDLKSGQTSCYEALIRLKNDSYYPDEFISVAEENQQIIQIGRWVLKEAVRQIAKWENDGKGYKKVSVNFSGIQLQDKEFCVYVEQILNEYNVAGESIEIEVTENVFIKQGEVVTQFFKEITSLGIDISIDDFGTGYSSLMYMISFPVKKIKLDRELIIKYMEENKNQALVKLIALVHSLGYVIVAEGVEELNDVKTLLRGNCDYIQGFYFSKPVEEYEIDKTTSYKII